jgi:hypothetical protein
MMTAPVRETIKEFLFAEVTKYWDGAGSTTGSSEVPSSFHALLAPTAMKMWHLASKHRFDATAGGWWENIAYLIGADYHQTAVRQHSVDGPLSGAAEAHIQQILKDMSHRPTQRQPNRVTDLREVLTVQGSRDSNCSTRSDLYLKRIDGTEIYFDIKNPEPNKRQCREMKERILTISALRIGHKTMALAGCAYIPNNPTGDGAGYDCGVPSNFLDVGADWLIGKAFWSVVGEESTYDEINEICKEVGIATEGKALSALGFGP